MSYNSEHQFRLKVETNETLIEFDGEFLTLIWIGIKT